MVRLHHRWMASVVLLVAALAPARAQEPAPPAFRLGEDARPERYEAQLAIDPRAAEFTGRIRIELVFTRPTQVLWLNATGLSIETVEVEQAARRIAVRTLPGGEDFVGLQAQAEPFAAGPAVATLRYRGRFELLGTRGLFRQQVSGDSYVLSQFEALSARRAFPCFDEPGFKTPWQLTIDAPAGNEVASNTPLESRSAVPGSGWQRHVFAPTKPLPSYLVALAVGPFDVVDGGRAGAKGTPLRYLAPRGRGAEMRWAKQATPRILEMMESYFGSPYPFEKLDSVVIPQLVAFGAMENVGLITYGARYILAKPHEETEAFRRLYVSLGAHEIAHMWFGNLVTLAWWDDIWLNEAFASWLGDKMTDRFHPDWNSGVYRAESRGRAIALDRLATTRVIAQPVRVKEDMAGAFDSITYSKGAAVLAMFEAAIGEQRFRDGVRQFVKRHEYGTAASTDFFRALGEAAGQSAATMRAFERFVTQPGAPLIDAALRCEAGSAQVALSQSRLRPAGSRAGNQLWSTPVCLRYRAGASTTTQCEMLEAESASFALKGAKTCPDWLVGNAEGVGHYVMRYDAALSRRAMARFAELPRAEAVTLAHDAGLLWESGLLPAEAALRWAETALRHPAPAVRHVTVKLLGRMRAAALSPKAAKVRSEVFARQLLPLARKVGWQERSGETDELRQLRLWLMPLAAQLDGGESLRVAARELALRWLEDRAAVGATVAPAVLETAGRFADRATYLRLEEAFLAATSDQERTPLLRSLAAVRDGELRGRMLGLALERLNAADTYSLLLAALGDDGNRRAALEFVRTHFEPLARKLPQHSPARLMMPLRALCTAEERDAFVEAFGSHAARFEGGPLAYRQSLESIEICLAREALERPGQAPGKRLTDSTKPRLLSASSSRAASSPPPMSSIVSTP